MVTVRPERMARIKALQRRPKAAAAAAGRPARSSLFLMITSAARSCRRLGLAALPRCSARARTRPASPDNPAVRSFLPSSLAKRFHCTGTVCSPLLLPFVLARPHRKTRRCRRLRRGRGGAARQRQRGAGDALVGAAEGEADVRVAVPARVALDGAHHGLEVHVAWAFGSFE